MNKKNIKTGLNPNGKKKIPAGWIATRKAAYKQARIEQYKKMRDAVPTDEQTAIMSRKAEIVRIHS